MRDKTLKQYYRFNHSKGIYLVDVDLDEYRDVYSEWDYSPMVNRDLDDDLIEYILEASFEIGLKRDMGLVFHIPKELENESRERRSILGIRHYFQYQIRKVRGQIMRQLKTSLIFLLIGMGFLVTAITLPTQTNIVLTTIREGLFIGAWVALWELFSIWFFQMAELRLKIKHYRRIIAMEIHYIGK